jgi:hypothetical protein
MDRSRGLLYGGIAVLVVLAVVSVTIVASRSPTKDVVEKRCPRLSSKPDIDSIQVENLASADKRVLANLAGYVQFGDITYLPLDIESLSVDYTNFNVTQVVKFWQMFLVPCQCLSAFSWRCLVIESSSLIFQSSRGGVVLCLCLAP